MTQFMETQDMSEDEIIGLKSTSIKFKNHIKLFVGISYLITIIFVAYIFKDKIRHKFFSILLFCLLLLFLSNI